MKRSPNWVIKSRHKGLSRKGFIGGVVGILWGHIGSSRTLVDWRKVEWCRRFTGLTSWPTATSHPGYRGHTHKEVQLFCNNLKNVNKSLTRVIFLASIPASRVGKNQKDTAA